MAGEFSIDLFDRESNITSLLAQISNNEVIDKTIVLFGAGAWGKDYLDSIRGYFKTVLFCDNDPEKWGTYIAGIQIIGFDDLRTLYAESYVTITSLDYYDQIFQQLTLNGMQDRILPPLYGFTDPAFSNYYNIVRENKVQFEETYTHLADDYSRQIYCGRINSCITANNKYLFPLRSKSAQYFDEKIISLSDNEIFVDGGAYTGDTVEEFLNQTSGNYLKVYSFEPEITKHQVFLNKYSDKQGIEFFPYGLWSENEVLRFESLDNGSSGLNEVGNVEVEVVSLDSVLKGKPVTFIKMDIEGAELEALKGAELTIRKYKPKLAICIYHKPLDIVQIPLFLKELVPEYKIYIRHYNISIFETVCYAVVEE